MMNRCFKCDPEMKHETSSGQHQHCQDQKATHVTSPSGDFFLTPQDIVYVECLCAGSNKRFWQVFELWKTLEKLQELLYEYLNTAFMGHFGT